MKEAELKIIGYQASFKVKVLLEKSKIWKGRVRFRKSKGDRQIVHVTFNPPLFPPYPGDIVDKLGELFGQMDEVARVNQEFLGLVLFLPEWCGFTDDFLPSVGEAFKRKGWNPENASYQTLVAGISGAGWPLEEVLQRIVDSYVPVPPVSVP